VTDVILYGENRCYDFLRRRQYIVLYIHFIDSILVLYRNFENLVKNDYVKRWVTAVVDNGFPILTASAAV